MPYECGLLTYLLTKWKKWQLYLKPFLFGPPMSCKIAHLISSYVKDREILKFCLWKSPWRSQIWNARITKDFHFFGLDCVQTEEMSHSASQSNGGCDLWTWQRKRKGKGNPSYLSAKECHEFIHIMTKNWQMQLSPKWKCPSIIRLV